MSLTTQQSRALGRGMAATVERSKEKHALTLEFEWTGRIPDNRLLAIIERTIEANFETQVTVTRNWHSELAAARASLERSEVHVEQLRQQVRGLEAQLEMQPPALETDPAISLKDWAASLCVSYSTAWRYKHAGRVKFINVGGGKKHDNVLVYPATFVPSVKKGNS